MATVSASDNKHLVPSADSAANSHMRDVIGNKGDSYAGDSIFAHSHVLEEHIHTEANVYPTLANGVAVLGGAAWTLGNFVEIVPASTIGSPFDLHFVNVEALDANDTFEIVLYAVEVEIGRVRVTKDATQAGLQSVPIITPIQAADVQIQAKVASSGGGDTATISLAYHTY